MKTTLERRRDGRANALSKRPPGSLMLTKSGSRILARRVTRSNSGGGENTRPRMIQTNIVV